VVWQGMKYRIFDNQFTTTHIASCPSNYDNSVIKFIEILTLAWKGQRGISEFQLGIVRRFYFIDRYDNWEYTKLCFCIFQTRVVIDYDFQYFSIATMARLWGIMILL
jgi:hypothetical protein